MPRTTLAALLAFAVLLVGPAPRPASAQSAAALLVGVQRIASPGVPGPLCIYGDRARAVVVGGAGGAARLPVVAVGPLGAGTVVAFGHGGYLDEPVLRTADTGRLLANAVRAVARRPADPRVGAVGATGAATYLRSEGFTVDDIGLDGLAGHDVILLGPWNEAPDQIAAIEAHVRAGNGLIVAATGWGWAQLNPERDLQMDYAGNRLLAAAGIQWADDWLSETAADGGYDALVVPSDLTTAPPALTAAEALDAGARTLTDDELAQVSRTLVLNAACIPPDDALFLPRLKAATGAAIIPSPADPVTRTVAVDRAVPAWHSTGLYAPPGEVITVDLAAGGEAMGLGLRIGAHTDTLWGTEDPWTRMPDIVRSWPVSASVTRAFSPYGGLIYVTVPEDGATGTLDVQIAGAVEAPLFLAGTTDPSAWRTRLRDLPAPWAEIGSGKMIGHRALKPRARPRRPVSGGGGVGSDHRPGRRAGHLAGATRARRALCHRPADRLRLHARGLSADVLPGRSTVPVK